MNMMTPETLKDLTKDAEVAENPALARLMKAWESKNAKRAAKGSGLTLMAVSLAACGGSSDDGEEPGPLDQVFTLTLGDDTLPEFQGGAGNDTFDAKLSSTVGGLVSGQTLQQADVLDGGAGLNTLNAELNGTGAAGEFGAAPSISNIQIFNLTATNADGVLNLINSTGYTELWNINSDGDLTLNNVREGAVIGLQGTNATTTYQVNFTSAAAADIVEQTVVANAVGGSTATGQRTTLDIRDAAAGNDGIETLTLSVSNGVRMELRNSAENIENLIITGTGPLVLSGQNNFPNLVTLNTTGNTFTGDLTLDVSGSAVLESVLTGVGNDFITVSAAAASSGDLSVNLGAGTDILGVDGVEGEGDIAGLDFTGGVTNVENLAFTSGVDLDDAATLDLDGFDDTLEAVWFFEGLTGGENFSLANAPEVLAINATNPLEADPDADREFVVDVLDTGAIEDLTITTDGELSINNMNAPSLASLALVQSGLDADGDGLGEIDLKITSDEDHDVSNLEAISAQADGGATVTLDASDADDADMDALTSVGVAAGGNATLNMTGVEQGAPGVSQEEEIFVQGVSFPASGGLVVFEYLVDNQTQTLTVPTVGFSANPLTPNGRVQTGENIAAAFDDLDEFSASFDPGSNIVTVTRNDFETYDPINVASVTGDRGIVNNGISQTAAAPQEPLEASGFEALEDVIVEAGEDAEVELTDVYGDFTVDVTAGENGLVTLDNTGATSASLSFGTDVEYTRDGDDNITGFDAGTNFGAIGVINSNSSLESVEISGAVAYIPLPAAPFILPVTLGGELTALQTVDLTGVTEQFLVDATGAEFGKDLGEPAFVTYMIGGTSSEWAGGGESFIDSSVGNRETFKFTDAEFGTIVINGFDAGSGGDRIDLADLGITNEGQIVIETGDFDANDGSFTIDAGGADVRILDDQGAPDFTGTIILTGTTEADLVSDNFTLL